MDRITHLYKEISRHNDLYWTKGEPEISDSQYDTMVEELKLLAPHHPILTKVHASLKDTGRAKVKRTIPMLSLDKVYSPEELIKWCEKVSRSETEMFEVQPKLDGVSAEWDNGTLSTRGDNGYEGEDISDKIPIIKVKLGDYEGSLVALNPRSFRGEILIRKSVFLANQNVLTRKGGQQYKHTRSAIIGILSDYKTRPEHAGIPELVSFDSYSVPLPLHAIKGLNWNDYIQRWKDWDYPIDGLVVKLQDTNYSHSLGYTSHHPKGQIALKFGNPTAETFLRDVVWQCGKNKLTPVGIVDPVIIDGYTVTNISLHNMNYINVNDIRIGNKILIERAGEIIPQYVKTLEFHGGPQPTLTNCPVCNSTAVYEDPELKCSNPNCSGSLLSRICDAVERIGIENIAEGTIKKLINNGKVTTLSEFLELQIQDFLELEGFAETSAKNAHEEILKVRRKPIEDWRLLSCLNIHTIGARMSKHILKNVTLDELVRMSREEMVKIDKVGPERADYIRSFFEDINNVKEWQSIILKFQGILDSKQNQKKFNGAVCFTGKSNQPRSYWSKLAEDNGFEFHKSVTKDLNYLVTNDINSTSSKTTKAKKHGISIITYEKFNEIIGQL